MPIKVREMIRRLEKDGWIYIGSTGGHRQFKHPIKPGKVTVPGQLSVEIPPGTANNILRQANLKQ